MRIQSITELYQRLPENERLLVDVLRQLIKEELPPYCREKFSWNVPLFRGNRSICIVCPGAIPGGGVKEGVLLGFWYGNRLEDADGYLTLGTNKQIL